ncbi:MAG: hypothetical protein V7K98_06255 [Nostoc sp.]
MGSGEWGDEGDKLINNAQCPMPHAPCPISEKNFATCNSFLTL